MKALIAELKQESNTFSKTQKLYNAFSSSVMSFGREAEVSMLSRHDDFSGFYDELKGAGIEDITVSACIDRQSGGIFPAEAFGLVVSTIVRDIKEQSPDIILLALTGATVTKNDEDAAGSLLAAARSAAGKGCIIGAVFDTHANMTEKCIENADFISGYKTIPHEDKYERGREMAALCVRAARKEISSSYTAMVKLPLIMQPELLDTSAQLMKDIKRTLDDAEKQKDVYTASVFTVKPWLNVKGVGTAVTVCAASGARALELAYGFADRLWQKRGEMKVDRVSVQSAIKAARAPHDKPALFIETADSPGAGAAGDSAEVLGELIKYGAGLKAVVNITDPGAARFSVMSGKGTDIRLRLGWYARPETESPLEINCRVERLPGPEFETDCAGLKGCVFDRGRSAVLSCGDITILVTENPVDNRDPRLYTTAGIDLAAADVVLVKSPCAFLAPYAGMYSQIIYLDTKGDTPLDLESLLYDNTGWDVYPVNKDGRFEPLVKICASVAGEGSKQKEE